MSNIHPPSTLPQARPVLQQKSQEKAWVAYLQNELNGCGYKPVLKVDGDFGEETTQAVKKFQAERDLKNDGIVGVKTWDMLDKYDKFPDYKPLRTGIAGSDTLLLVNFNMIAEATKFMGICPSFWGRYFADDSQINNGEYNHKEENSVLHAAGIRILPICRKTYRIGGSKADGNEVGREVVRDVLLETFGKDYLASQGRNFYIFLDTEPEDLETGHPALSPDYYLGWSKAVTEASLEFSDNQVKFLPCVYLNPTADDKTVPALSQAINDQHAECYGLWIARYYENPRVSPWFLPITGLPSRVLIHQYVGDINHDGQVDEKNGIYDFNQINPYLEEPDSEVLRRFILPQPVSN